MMTVKTHLPTPFSSPAVTSGQAEDRRERVVETLTMLATMAAGYCHQLHL